MTRRVLLLAFGTLGDVLPYIALGRGFTAAGDQVCIVTHERFAAMARAQALEVHAIADDPETLLQSPEGHAWVSSGDRPWRFGFALRRALRPRIAVYLRAAWKAAEDANVVIASGLAVFVASTIAERRGIPWVPAFLAPVTRGGGLPNAFGSGGRGWPFSGSLGHMLHWEGTWALLRGSLNRARREVLDLPPLGVAPPFGLDPRRVLWLYGFSTAVVPRPAAWPPSVHVTGYWFLSVAEPPGDALCTFLDAHPGAVCIGFGSMSDLAPAETDEILIAAIRAAHVPAVLLSGWSGRTLAAEEEGVIRLRAAPHAWLFERVAAVVHHGGSGTVAATLRVGVPSVVVPHFGDQNFWAATLHRCGAAPPPLPRARLTAPSLTAAITAAVRQPQYRVAARRIAARIAAEDGVGTAVAAVHRYLDAGGRA